MKETTTIAIILLAFFLAGCTTNNLSTVKQNSDQQDGVNLSTESEETNKITKKTEKMFSIPVVSINIAFPENYTISKNTEENRRGAFVSYDFQYKQPWNEPAFQEIQFFSEESIRQFTEKCSDDNPCFFGDYPTLERYNGQKNAYIKKESYKDYELKKFDDRDYFVSSFKCTGDGCVIREYTTFVGDTKIDIWINMPNEVTESQADELFKQFKIVE